MPAHADILDDRESLSRPFLGSVLFHAGVIAAIIGWTSYSPATRISLGEQNPGFGSSVPVNSVHSIPLPPRPGPKNPVANDTESLVPQRTETKPQPRPKQHPVVKDAIPLKNKTPEKTAQHDYLLQKYRNQPPKPNQVPSDQAPAAVSQMYIKAGTQAGIGVNPNSVLGTRFGGYAQLLKEAIASHWNTGGLAGVRTPMAIINVDILRDGTIRNARIAQSSGNYTLDTSAMRAVIEAAPLPKLPPEYNGSYLNVDFQFQLQP